VLGFVLYNGRSYILMNLFLSFLGGVGKIVPEIVSLSFFQISWHI